MRTVCIVGFCAAALFLLGGASVTVHPDAVESLGHAMIAAACVALVCAAGWLLHGTKRPSLLATPSAKAALRRSGRILLTVLAVGGTFQCGRTVQEIEMRANGFVAVEVQEGVTLCLATPQRPICLAVVRDTLNPAAFSYALDEPNVSCRIEQGGRVLFEGDVRRIVRCVPDPPESGPLTITLHIRETASSFAGCRLLCGSPL